MRTKEDGPEIKPSPNTDWPKRIIGIITYILANLILTPIYFQLSIGVWINAAPFNKLDPLEGCIGETCTDPNYFIVTGCCLMMLIGFSATSFLGAKIGAFQDFWRAFIIMLAMPLSLIAVCVLIAV